MRRRSEEHTSELQSLRHLVCRLLLEKRNLRYYLKSVPGVAEAAPLGAAVRQYQVNLEQNKLQSFNIPVSKVVAAVRIFFNDTATTEIYTLSLHDALPI